MYQCKVSKYRYLIVSLLLLVTIIVWWPTSVALLSIRIALNKGKSLQNIQFIVSNIVVVKNNKHRYLTCDLVVKSENLNLLKNIQLALACILQQTFHYV